MLLKHPIWFRLLRSRCRGAKKRSAYNLALEAPSMGYILGQRTCPDFRVGAAQMSRVGCEIAATYNALRICKRGRACAELIRIFEESGYLMAGGRFGTDPYAIGEFFTDAGIPFFRYSDFASMCEAAEGCRGRGSVFILSFWNRRRIWGGLHTIAFYTCKADRLLHVLNFHGNDSGILTTERFSALTDAERFVTGYRLAVDK